MGGQEYNTPNSLTTNKMILYDLEFQQVKVITNEDKLLPFNPSYGCMNYDYINRKIYWIGGQDTLNKTFDFINEIWEASLLINNETLQPFIPTLYTTTQTVTTTLSGDNIVISSVNETQIVTKSNNDKKDVDILESNTITIILIVACCFVLVIVIIALIFFIRKKRNNDIESKVGTTNDITVQKDDSNNEELIEMNSNKDNKPLVKNVVSNEINSDIKQAYSIQDDEMQQNTVENIGSMSHNSMSKNVMIEMPNGQMMIAQVITPVSIEQINNVKTIANGSPKFIRTKSEELYGDTKHEEQLEGVLNNNNKDTDTLTMTNARI
eukprot:315059_1